MLAEGILEPKSMNNAIPNMIYTRMGSAVLARTMGKQHMFAAMYAINLRLGSQA